MSPGALSIRPKIPVWYSGTLGQPQEVYPNFRNFIPKFPEFLVEWKAPPVSLRLLPLVVQQAPCAGIRRVNNWNSVFRFKRFYSIKEKMHRKVFIAQNKTLRRKQFNSESWYSFHLQVISPLWGTSRLMYSSSTGISAHLKSKKTGSNSLAARGITIKRSSK